MANAPWLDEAQKYVGLKEIVGSKHEKEVLRFFADAGHPEVHDDETAWCAAFVGAMLRRSGYKSTGSLLARSYEKFGEKLNAPTPGCIVVMQRGNSTWQGHVGFCVSATENYIKVLGGNQGNAVSIATYSRKFVIAYRWPTEKVKGIAQSKIAASAGTIATTEAADAGVQINDAIDKATQAKQAADGLGLTDVIAQLSHNPRFWIAVVVVLICAGIIYFRWRDHGRGQ